ncbi:MAG: hypothetical protein ACSHW1_17100 [Yoonia sp.]|uniref:hypothetical protein n=1 Tax=Yoonia sp. TaxID=2212373 RepID=UPI003EF5EE7D
MALRFILDHSRDLTDPQDSAKATAQALIVQGLREVAGLPCAVHAGSARRVVARVPPDEEPTQPL